jgi:hypothetical protein
MSTETQNPVEAPVTTEVTTEATKEVTTQAVAEEQTEEQAESRKYSDNFKVFGDGVTPPISLGNINEHNGRMFVNLNIKTLTDVNNGYDNAVFTYPTQVQGRVSARMVQDMHNRYGGLKRGDYVLAVIVGNRVDKLLPIQAAASKEIVITKKPAAFVPTEAPAEKADDVVSMMPPVDEDADATDTPATEVKPMTAAEKKAAKEEAAKAEAAAKSDLPF